METSDSRIKICSYCGEEISIYSTRCEYCGSILDEKTKAYSVNKADKPVVTSAYITEPVDIQKPLMTSEENKAAEHDYSARLKSNRVPQLQVQSNKSLKPLKNGRKVFITTICTLIPGFGQLAGVIIGILLLNAEDDSDRNSFGRALLISSIFVFLISSMVYFLTVLVLLPIIN